MSDPAIRSTELTDLPAVIFLYRQVEALHAEVRPDLVTVAEGEALQATLTTLLSDPDVCNLVIEAHGGVVGYARYRISQVPAVSLSPRAGQAQATIEELMISAEHRREKLATRMLREIESRLGEQGVPLIRLSVYDFSIDAQYLYSGLGYEPVKLELEKRVSPPDARPGTLAPAVR